MFFNGGAISVHSNFLAWEISFIDGHGALGLTGVGLDGSPSSSRLADVVNTIGCLMEPLPLE